MKIIDDKEVGKIWKGCARLPMRTVFQQECCDLIRKLVAERAASYAGEEPTLPSDTQEALNDFRIDIKDWKDDD